MAGYIKFSISDRLLSSTLGVKNRRVFKLPDGITLYQVELFNGLNIVVMSKPPESVAGGLSKQAISFFDHEIVETYRGKLTIMMQVFDLTANSYVFDISSVTSAGKSTIGNLRATKTGVLQYNRQDIERVKSQRLLTKALILEGK